jgi:tRNA(fMet)-specific endonuclease VapC
VPPALLDTNALSDVMANHAPMKAHMANHTGPTLTSVIVVGEIRFGLDRLPVGKRRSDLETKARNSLAALLREPITQPIAESYGRLRATLEAQGLSVPDNDLWIAATAFTLGAIVVTRDQIFRQVPGLQVEDWSV